MSDLKLVDNGDGGDFILKGNDLVVIEGFENMPYLGMFGGNIESSTGETRPSELRSDWWGNSLFMPNNSSIQFNSSLQRLLKNVPLNTQTRAEIEEVVKQDLEFMKAFSNLEVFVALISVDRIQINIIISEPENPQSTEFVYIWDATQMELTNVSDLEQYPSDPSDNLYVELDYIDDYFI